MALAIRSTEDPVEYKDPLDFNTSSNSLVLTPLREWRPFTITTDSYISLCSRVYAALCVKDVNFAAKMPESAFQYYAVILLWKRIAQLVPESVKKQWPFLSDLPQLTQGQYYIPQPLETYLKGIGNYIDPDGCNRNFTLPRFPIENKELNISQTFGRVNKDTHVFYESFPAPGISGLRILADIKYTMNPSDDNLNWDLPDSLRPSLQDLKHCCEDSDGSTASVKPTRNLLGWAPAQCLSDKQSEQLKSWNMDKTFFQEPWSGLSTDFTGLFNKISQSIIDYIYYNKKGFILLNATSKMGSIAQGLSIEKQFKSFDFDRSALYCEGDLSIRSPYNLNDVRLTEGALIAGYRMAKEPIGDRHCWSCYDFDGYKSVPQSWIASRNDIYSFGCVGKLNEPIYTTAHANKRIMQNDCIAHSIFEGTDQWNIYM